MPNQNTEAADLHAIGRRALLKGSTLALGAATIRPSYAGESPAAVAKANAPTIVANAQAATVEISSGKIAGAVFRGIYAFKGIPYGESTANENRFLPPKAVKPWSGVRSSRQYGAVCPQDKGTGRRNDEEAFIFQWNDSFEEEDCLRINLWTPAISDNKKRPVMVWLHGGGFAAGSGNDLPAFDGENLARRGDVVVITLNHRLNILGFLDLSHYSARYAQSANVGMLDIVAALEWVRDNIASFGGDPGCVTIFGQSGGGAKVSTLMGMPAARGLFHRAIVQSGSFSLSKTQEKSRRLADLVLAELGLDGTSLERIHGLDYAELRRASETVLARVNPPMDIMLTIRNMGSLLGFGPVVDGYVLPQIPFGEKASALSADVPMIIGTTLNEFTTGINHPDFEAMSEAELEAKTDHYYPGRAQEIIAAFRRTTPGAKPADLYSRIASAPVRMSAVQQAASKAALRRSPAYLYWFAWQTPIFDGRPRAFHCAEIPFVFCNTERCASMTGGGSVPAALSAQIADAWISFARSGDPNHAGLPAWPRFSVDTAPSMIFDNACQVVMSPDGQELNSIG